MNIDVSRCNGSYLFRLMILAISFCVFSVFIAFSGNIFGVDTMLLFFVGVVLLLIAQKKVQEVYSSKKLAFIAFFILLLLFIPIYINQAILSTLGISLKLHVLFFGLGCFLSFYIIFKNFPKLWRDFFVFRLLFLFFIANIFYYFFYHSDFQLSQSSIGYNILFSSDFSNQSAYFIALISSISALIGLTSGLELSYNIDKINIKKIFKFLSYNFSILLISSLFFSLVGIMPYEQFGFRIKGGILNIPGAHLLLGFFSIIFSCSTIFLKDISGKYLKYSVIFNLFSCYLLTALFLNKSSIIALLASTIMFLVGLKIKKLVDFNIFKLFNLKLNYDTAPFALLGILLFFFLIINFQENILSYFYGLFERFSNSKTLNTRLNLWNSFIESWFFDLSVIKAFLGFGTGSTRETIFYISAMSPNLHIVQTVHNSYFSMIYDYGLVCFLYWGGILGVFANNLKNFLATKIAYNSMLSLCINCIIVFFLIYHLTDGIRVLTQIEFFCILGFLVGLSKNWTSNFEGDR